MAEHIEAFMKMKISTQTGKGFIFLTGGSVDAVK